MRPVLQQLQSRLRLKSRSCYGTPMMLMPNSKFRLAFSFALVCFSLPSNASPAKSNPLPPTKLLCEVSYAGTTHQVLSERIDDPYMAPLHDIGGRFRFKSVLLGSQKQIETIKLYAYFQTREKDILIHEAIYRAPFLHLPKQTKTQRTALTPVNHLYAGEVERELIYQCFFI